MLKFLFGIVMSLLHVTLNLLLLASFVLRETVLILLNFLLELSFQDGQIRILFIDVDLLHVLLFDYETLLVLPQCGLLFSLIVPREYDEILIDLFLLESGLLHGIVLGEWMWFLSGIYVIYITFIILLFRMLMLLSIINDLSSSISLPNSNGRIPLFIIMILYYPVVYYLLRFTLLLGGGLYSWIIYSCSSRTSSSLYYSTAYLNLFMPD